MFQNLKCINYLCTIPYRFTVRVDDRIDAVVFHEHAGLFSLVLADAGILTGGDAPCHIGHFCICVDVDDRDLGCGRIRDFVCRLHQESV